MRRLFTRSKRQLLIYIILIVWVSFGVLGFATGVDFASLAAYVGVFIPGAMTYILGETRRPHGTTHRPDS